MRKQETIDHQLDHFVQYFERQKEIFRLDRLHFEHKEDRHQWQHFRDHKEVFLQHCGSFSVGFAQKIFEHESEQFELDWLERVKHFEQFNPRRIRLACQHSCCDRGISLSRSYSLVSGRRDYLPLLLVV